MINKTQNIRIDQIDSQEDSGIGDSCGAPDSTAKHIELNLKEGRISGESVVALYHRADDCIRKET